MEIGPAREVLLFGAYATIFAVVGLLSLVAAFRWRSARPAGIWLAVAMLLHCVTLLSGSTPIRPALGGAPLMWRWVTAIGGYWIGIPWTLLVEDIVGSGWKSTIRRTWQGFAAFAVFATAWDLYTGHPFSVPGPWNAVVFGTGAAVGLSNLFLGGVRPVPEIRVLRAGYAAFMVVVIHDDLVRLGFTPWTWQTGQLGVLTFLACLVYTIVSRTLRGHSQLQSIEHELATARRIQQQLLPLVAPPLDGAAIAFRHIPAASVAGDMFQFLGAGPQRVGILVADVSGHGVPAALIASMVKIAAAAQSGHADDPGLVLGGIYQSIAGELPSGQFVTAVYVYVDLDRGVLRHAAAGHPPALIRRASDGRVFPAGKAGPLMMSLVPPEYPVSEVRLDPGDRVVLYTDGIVEAMRVDGEMFDVERLSTNAVNVPVGPEVFVDATIKAVSAFVGRTDPAFDDDCTIVALEVAPSASRRFPAAIDAERFACT